MSPVYVDASAAVKLFKPELESVALRVHLAREPVWISTELVEVELRCTAHRLGADRRAGAERVLNRIDLVPLSTEVRERAGAGFSPALRALDAIHLATALSMAEDLDAFFAYDAELCEAAGGAGLSVRSPE